MPTRILRQANIGFLVIFLYVATSTHICLAASSENAVIWANQNVINLERVAERQKPPVYHIVSVFYSRLIRWRSFATFYDALYENPEFAKKYPAAVDPSQGPFAAILVPGQKLTDLEPYKKWRGKTVGEIFGYPGEAGERKIDDLPGDGSRLSVVVSQEFLSNSVTGVYNTIYHEFGHLVHLSLLTPDEFQQLETLYSNAGNENRYLDDYAAINSSEYFAQGLEAYLSESKPGITWKYWKHTKSDLKRKDPALYNFIEKLLKKSH